MPLSTGDRVGSYEIVSRLGSGGMGIVYRAHDAKLERDVAIKLLSVQGATDPDRLRRFEQEARASSALDHPNIITIHEIGETDAGLPFIVMQLVDGKSLRELIESKRLSLEETLRIATQIADGLSRAHRQGIIHRDLKPDNVMVNEDGLVKILDFGLAKLAEPTVGSELATIDRAKPQTAEGCIVGTAHYMSPEQAQGETVDTRSDIFSFGALLYEMITGRRPFRGGNTVAILAEIVQKDPERMSAINPTLPLDLDKIVNRALRKDPDRRFQSVADMKVALAELSEELESGDALTASDVRAGARKQERWWPLAVAVGLGGVVVALVTTMRPTEIAPLSIVPVTTDAGNEFEPALSPDGTQLAFVKNRRIYVQLIGEGEPVALTDGEPADVSPTWSPDGARVAFLRHRSATDHDLMEVPALGGTPRVLGRARGPGHGISYSPDGKQLAVIHRESVDEPGGVFLLSTDTGEHRRLTTPPSDGTSDRYPKFSPDGKSIVFERIGPGPLPPRTGDILVYDLAEGHARVLVSGPGWIHGSDFTSDSRHVVYSAGLSWDSMHLNMVAIEGGAPTGVLPGERAATPSLARDANRLVYAKALDDWNIWRVNGPTASERTPPERIVGSTWWDMTPDVSPDGNKLAFMSSRSGQWQIWVTGADGSSPRQITTDETLAGGPRWSPDGTRLAFHAMDTSNVGQVHVIDAAGGFARKLTEGESTNLYPAWSKDGRYIFFHSERGDELDIGQVSAQGGRVELVVRNASFAVPLENDDLVFERDGAVWSLSAGDSDATNLLDSSTFRWTAWENKIFDFNRIGDGFSIDVFDRRSGALTTIGEIGESPNLSNPTVSADGKWIYYQQRDASGIDIMLAENFVP